MMVDNRNILDSVPVIDIGPLLSSVDGNPEMKLRCIHELFDACREWGFFYIQNHGLSDKDISRFRQNVSEFFHLPQEVLTEIKRNQENSRGYFDDELTKNKLDWKRCFDFGAQDGSLDKEGMDGKNQWPSVSDHETFEQVMRDYFDQMEKLSEILLGAICESLDLPSDSLRQFFESNHTSYLRLNYYPVCPNPESHMAIHHHTDAGALTILYQDSDVTSLQVKRGDKWFFIPPKEGTYVINIGDMVQIWSNDLFKAPLHRVQANSSKERYSAPFFFNPAYKADVAPILSEESTDNQKPQYKPVNWGEFRGKRFAGDFADVGEEVQIAHYKL